ncbi:MAG: nucleoside/nucleotide kinase family protein [Formosimonas sp.]
MNSALKQRIQTLLNSGRRQMIGLVGAPGAGKSTLAEQMVQHFGDAVAYVPMDGFHLSNAQLARLNRAERKGAPDTFDVDGYVALLARIRRAEHTVYAPRFERSLEESIAHSIAIEPSTPLVLTEGNYLLLQTHGWQNVRPLLDECGYVEVDDALRRQRLIARHMQFGRSASAAQDWVNSTDEPNARLIAAARARADWVVEFS